MKAFLCKLFLCLLPISLTPFWGYLIADGYLNFGGGEKDLFLLIPWIVWSLLYSLIFIAAWIRHKKVLRMLLYSTAGATTVLSLIWGLLYLWANHLLGAYKG